MNFRRSSSVEALAPSPIARRDARAKPKWIETALKKFPGRFQRETSFQDVSSANIRNHSAEFQSVRNVPKHAGRNVEVRSTAAELEIFAAELEISAASQTHRVPSLLTVVRSALVVVPNDDNICMPMPLVCLGPSIGIQGQRASTR